MKDFIKFLKSTVVYLLGNVLIKMISFFMIPIYTKYINPADYGIYDLHIAYVTFLSSILFLDIWGGIMRFMFDYKSKNDKAKPIVSGSAIFLISTLIYTVLVFIFNMFMDINFIGLLYLYGLFMNLQHLFGYIARGYGKNILYASSGLIGSFVTIVCNIVLLVYLRMGYEALYISSCIGFFINILIIFTGIKSYKFFSVKYFEKKLFKEMYVYALPLCINSVAYWFLTSYNKIVINNSLSSHENGLYAIAAKFGVAVNLFTSCFQMAWQELTFSKSGTSRKELGEFYSTGINEYIKFLGIGVLIMLPAINVFFPYIVNESYHDAINIVPFYLLATISSAISSFLASIFSTIKKTNYIFKTTLAGSIVNIISIYLLIGSLGVQAASISLFIGFTVNVIRRISILRRYIDLKINYRFLLLYSVPLIIIIFVYLNLSVVYNIIIEVIILSVSIYIYRDKIMYFKNRLEKK